jgi:predicted transcriptional regulator
MGIVDKLTPRQCLVVREILTHQKGLLRKEIADRTGKNEKTVERILKSLPPWVVIKKRDSTMNGSPYRYKGRLRRKSFGVFIEKLQALHVKKLQSIHKKTALGTVPSGTP